MWVKFHDHRRLGFWSGVPRATRFVLLELELLCRPGSGEVELPPGKDPISRTIEMLGGNRREARKALLFLASAECQAVLYRSPDGSLIDPVSSSNGRLLVVIPSWSGDNSVTSSAQRMRQLRAKRKEEREVTKKRDASQASPCDASRDALEKRREEKRRSPTTSGVARARDGQPPPSDSNLTDDEQAEKVSPATGICRRCGRPNDRYQRTNGKLCSSCHAEGKRRGRQHPRDQGYESGLLSAEAEQIHELLLKHRLPLNSPVGMANHIAGRLGPLGNNKLTVPRVQLAIEAVAEKTAAAAADGAPRTSEEVRDHIQSFLRMSAGRWKELERKCAEDGRGLVKAQPAASYHRPYRKEDQPRCVPKDVRKLVEGIG